MGKLETLPTAANYESVMDAIGASVIVVGYESADRVGNRISLADLLRQYKQYAEQTGLSKELSKDLYIKLIFDSNGNYWACFSYESSFVTKSEHVINHTRMVNLVRGFTAQTLNPTDLKGKYGCNLMLNIEGDEGTFVTSTDSPLLVKTKEGDSALTNFLKQNGFKIKNEKYTTFGL